MKINLFKTIFIVIALLFGAYLQGQQVSGDIAKQATGTATGSIKLIDNKGTIKYLQTANGLTVLTNSTNNKTTTTWQLGGTLTNNTYIDVDGNTFGLDGLQLVNTTTASASTNATDQSNRGTGTGWTLLVRDEASGAIQKLLATDLIQSGTVEHTAAADSTANVNVTATGISTNASQVWVYRNGAKLISGTDYTVAVNQVTLIPGTGANSLLIYSGDRFEIQWIK